MPSDVGASRGLTYVCVILPAEEMWLRGPLSAEFPWMPAGLSPEAGSLASSAFSLFGSGLAVVAALAEGLSVVGGVVFVESPSCSECVGMVDDVVCDL
jgi:hypothetical protein